MLKIFPKYISVTAHKANKFSKNYKVNQKTTDKIVIKAKTDRYKIAFTDAKR